VTGFLFDGLDASYFFATIIYPVTTVPGSDLITIVIRLFKHKKGRKNRPFFYALKIA
jgi:hypothetical protein